MSKVYTVMTWNVAAGLGPTKFRGRNPPLVAVAGSIQHALSFRGNLPIYRKKRNIIKDRVQKIGEYIKKCDPDILVLNELDRRFFGIDQLEVIKKISGLSHSVFTSCFRSKSMILDGDNGNAILSKRPFLPLEPSIWSKDCDHKVYYIDISRPHNRFAEWYGLIAGKLLWGRRMIRVRVDFDGVEQEICASHFHDRGDVRVTQAKKVRTILEKVGRPGLLIGDLNTTTQGDKIIYPHGSKKRFKGKALREIEKIVHKPHLPEDFTLFENGENGNIKRMPGTYPVIVKKKRRSLLRRRKKVQKESEKKESNQTEIHPPDRHIDYILPVDPNPKLSKKEKLKIPKVKEIIIGDAILSDHFPVIAKISFEEG